MAQNVQRACGIQKFHQILFRQRSPGRLKVSLNTVCDPICKKIPFPHISHGSKQYTTKSDS